MPQKPDLVYPSLDDFVDVNESVSDSVVKQPTVESNEPKTVLKENGAPIIKDWVSERQSTNEFEGVIDSGCSRHMTWNISYLLDYEDIDGGYVKKTFLLLSPTNPHHTPTIIQPSTYQPSRKHKSRKTKRKDIELPQTSVPIEHVVDEAVNEKMDDSLERAITTATSLDAEQDMGNIINVHRDEDIFDVNDQDYTLMFDADKDLQGEEVVVEKEVAGKDVSAIEEVNTASIVTSITATTTTIAITPTISMDEITLVKALIYIKTSRPNAKGIVMQEPSETPTTTLIVSSQNLSKVQDKGKGTMVEEPLKIKKKDQILFDEEVARKIQE
nr:hypothetical protein [Tanacetum cinerariifolium]